MKYLAAYALLSLSGKNNINADDIKKVLGAAEASCDDDDIKRLLESVKGKKVHELIANGTKKIGSSGPAQPSAAVAKETAKQAVKQAPKKKEQAKKKEAPPPAADDEDDFMAGGLFD